MKKFLSLAFVLILALNLASCGNGKKAEKTAGTVTLRVHCETILDNGASENDFPGIPEIFKGEVPIAAGDTAFDVIDYALKGRKIHFEAENSSYGMYVKGIANVYSGDFGETSGWLFKVNGEFAEVSCSDYKVQDGDEIELVYSCVMGDVE